MSLEERVEKICEIVCKHFVYDDVFVDELPRKRNGTRLARIKFCSYNTDDFLYRELASNRIIISLHDAGIEIEDINAHRSTNMLSKKNYDSIFIFVVVDCL